MTTNTLIDYAIMLAIGIAFGWALYYMLVTL